MQVFYILIIMNQYKKAAVPNGNSGF